MTVLPDAHPRAIVFIPTMLRQPRLLSDVTELAVRRRLDSLNRERRESVCVCVCMCRHGFVRLRHAGECFTVTVFRFGEEIKENTDEEEEGGKEKKKVAAFGAQWNFKMENSSSNSRFRSAMFNHGESPHPTLNAEMLVYFLNRTYLRINK